MPDLVSSCHGAPVWVAGRSTHYYVCKACGKPCDGVTAAERLRLRLRDKEELVKQAWKDEAFRTLADS